VKGGYEKRGREEKLPKKINRYKTESSKSRSREILGQKFDVRLAKLQKNHESKEKGGGRIEKRRGGLTRKGVKLAVV